MCSTLSQLPPPGFRVKYSLEILWSWKIAESQGQFYSAVDLGELAAELDTMERRRMAEVTNLPFSKPNLKVDIKLSNLMLIQMGEDSAEYRAFIAQPSANMDDSGFFSVQVHISCNCSAYEQV